jgi:plastocyanin/DNA/RNA endonuclease YhcR with UshA esterase domain
MKLRILIACALTALLSNANATVHNITVGSNFFNPNSVTVAVGDTVIWTNTSGNHNVNGATSVFPSNPASFGNTVGPAGWVYQHVFNLPGTYNYQCDPHAPGMSGTVNVVVGTPTSDLLISGVYDGSLTGGNPKGIELYVVNDIPNLSLYGVGSANNGGGTDGQEFTFPAVAVTAGQYLYVTTDTALFRTFFGRGAQYQTGAMGINGDDAVELFSNGAVADVFGDINLSGTGTPWEYLDSWAYRVNGTGPDGSTFVLANWTFGGINVYDPVTTNAAANPAMAIGTYNRTMAPVFATIASLTTNDAQGVANSLNTQTTISGTVYTIDFDGNTGYSFYMYDATGGINVFRGSDLPYYTAPARGDELIVYGEIDQFNGLTEIVPDSIYVVSTGNSLVTPVVVTDLDESTESEYIRMDNMYLATPSQWPTSTGSANVDITNGTDTFVMRIDSDTDIDGTPAPTGTFSVIGAGGQFDNTSPYTEGYQIFPRDLNDIILAGTIGAGGIPTYNIATVTTSDVNGVADSLNAEVRLHGIVYTDDFDGNAGYSFFMYDNTGGINVFNFNDVGTFVVNRGDSIRVIGSIDQFNGLTEIVIDSVVVLSTGHTLKMPAVVASLDESTESEYIRMNNMTLVTPSQWPASGSSANVDITDGTNTFTLRIDSDTDIDGSTAPTGAFDVIGAGGQFDSSNPFTTGYQIQPRDLTDIIPVVAATPTVGFAASTRSVLENAGSVTVNLPIAPSSTTAETVKIYVSNGAGVTAADYTTTPAAVADTITLSAAANATAVSFSVNVVDDAILEANEDITFTVARVSSGLSISTTLNAQVFTIQDNDTPIPTYDIAQIDGTDALGVMDSSGVYCKIIATVTSPQLSATRTDFFITNATNTAGIKVNQATLIAYNAVVGDQIRVVGELSQFRGGIQISADSLTVLSSGNPIQPTVQPATAGMAEPEEGRVLRYNGVELVDSTGWPSANFGNFDIVLANGDTVILRLDSDIPTLWGPAPVGKFDVIGIAGQYSTTSTAPFLDGYQIQPRISTEIIVVLPKLAITEVMPSSNLSGAIGGDWFELTNYGSTPITLNGFSWDDNSRTAGTHTIASLTSLIINAGQSIIFYDGVHPEDSAWAYEWSQAANNIVVIGADDFGPIGFSGLGSGGDEVNFYDDKGQLISRATYVGGDISPGVSVEFDTAGVKLGQSTVGVRGAYASLGGDIGSPGNMMPISIAELLLTNMSIYPNPATDRVQISTATNAPKSFSLLDMTGNRIMQVESTQETVSLNVANLPAGVYLLQVNVDGQRATRKLIVQ